MDLERDSHPQVTTLLWTVVASDSGLGSNIGPVYFPHAIVEGSCGPFKSGPTSRQRSK